MKSVFLIVVLFLASGCSKEKRIERNLWRNGGEWNIKVFTYQYSNDNVNSVNYNSPPQIYLDAGEFVFKKDGSGYITLTEDNQTETTGFKWLSSVDKITIIPNGGTATDYNLVWKKNNITISEKYTDVDPDNVTYTSITKFECVKK
jgi:hypothetical protein